MIHRSTDPTCKNCTGQGGFCMCDESRAPCRCPGPKGNGAPEHFRWSGGICHTCNGFGWRQSTRTVRVYRVRLDAQGYERGLYYWGKGVPLYRAEECDGETEEVRAHSRQDAIRIFGIPKERLVRPW